VPEVVVPIKELRVGDTLTIYGITCTVTTAPHCVGKGAAGRIWAFDAKGEQNPARTFTALEKKHYKVTRDD
jgi:hypothetical protein